MAGLSDNYVTVSAIYETHTDDAVRVNADDTGRIPLMRWISFKLIHAADEVKIVELDPWRDRGTPITFRVREWKATKAELKVI